MTFKNFKWGTFLWFVAAVDHAVDRRPALIRKTLPVLRIYMQTVHFVTTLLCDHNTPPSNFLRYRFCPSSAVIAEEKETVGIVVPAMFRCQDVGTRLWSPCNYSPCHQFVRKEARVTRCLAVSGTVTHFQNYFLCVPLIETLSLSLFFKCVFDNLSSNSCVRRQQWAFIRGRCGLSDHVNQTGTRTQVKGTPNNKKQCNSGQNGKQHETEASTTRRLRLRRGNAGTIKAGKRSFPVWNQCKASLATFWSLLESFFTRRWIWRETSYSGEQTHTHAHAGTISS